MQKTWAAAQRVMLLVAAIMTRPTVHMTTIRVIPWGRPQVSRILARGSLAMPATMLATIQVTPVREWLPTVLVTKGVKARMTTSSSEVIK